MIIRQFWKAPFRQLVWPSPHKDSFPFWTESSFLEGSELDQHNIKPKENYMDRSCEHLKNLNETDFAPLKAPVACEECLKEGTQWVSLRQCRTCGHVGCCD